MSLILLRGALEQGLIYGLVALGLYLSFRTLNVADLTVDGSFTLGAATAATMTVAGRPLMGLAVAAAAGACAGFVTAVLQTRLKVQSILAGIITMTALYSINLRVMGNRANLPLLRRDTVFSLWNSALPLALRPYGRLMIGLAVILCLCLAMAVFLRTRLGLSIRATGDNPAMVRASSINPAFTITVGLCISNGLTALSGAFIAQYQLFCDITMGTGMVVIGLASLIIGEVICGAFRRPSVRRGIAAAAVGGVIYWIIIATAISSSVSANDLKLVSAVIVAAAISWPVISERIELFKLRKKARQDADA